MLGVAAWAFWTGNPFSGFLYVNYAIANAMLAFVKG